MKTIQDNPNKTTQHAFDSGPQLPIEAKTVIDETTAGIVRPTVKVYSDKDNEAISRMQTR